MGMDRVGGPGGSALAIQISQAGWKDVFHLSIYSTSWIVLASTCKYLQVMG